MLSLIGAGWGGCTVSLVSETNVHSFIQKLKEAYTPYRAMDDDQLREVVFATKPGGGACGELVIQTQCSPVIERLCLFSVQARLRWHAAGALYEPALIVLTALRIFVTT